MHVNDLGFTFAAVWTSSLGEFPLFDTRFCLDLFGDPYQTATNISAEGFVITRVGVPPLTVAPAAVVGPARVVFTAPVLDQLTDICERLWPPLREWAASRGHALACSAIGVNSEHEITGLDAPATEWLLRRFSPPAPPDAGMRPTGHTNLATQVMVDNRRWEIVLQPRAGRTDALYALVNQEDTAVRELPDRALLLAAFERRAPALTTRVWPWLLGADHRGG